MPDGFATNFISVSLCLRLHRDVCQLFSIVMLGPLSTYSLILLCLSAFSKLVKLVFQVHDYIFCLVHAICYLNTKLLLQCLPLMIFVI